MQDLIGMERFAPGLAALSQEEMAAIHVFLLRK